MTERPRNESVRNGVAPAPAERVCGVVARPALRDHLGERRSRTGARRSAAGTPRGCADPRRRRCRRRSRRAFSTATAMSESVMPTTMRLWASCDTDDARAPRVEPRSRDEAVADTPCGEVPLDDRDLREIASCVCDREAVGDGGLDDDRVRHHLIRDQPDRARIESSCAGIAKSAAATGRMRTLCRTQSGISIGRCSRRSGARSSARSRARRSRDRGGGAGQRDTPARWRHGAAGRARAPD